MTETAEAFKEVLKRREAQVLELLDLAAQIDDGAEQRDQLNSDLAALREQKRALEASVNQRQNQLADLGQQVVAKRAERDKIISNAAEEAAIVKDEARVAATGLRVSAQDAFTQVQASIGVIRRKLQEECDRLRAYRDRLSEEVRSLEAEVNRLKRTLNATG